MAPASDASQKSISISLLIPIALAAASAMAGYYAALDGMRVREAEMASDARWLRNSVDDIKKDLNGFRDAIDAIQSDLAKLHGQSEEHLRFHDRTTPMPNRRGEVKPAKPAHALLAPKG